MSPTQASAADDRDFPRLNGRNFIIWKTRVTAALEGKSLLGFATQVDYTGDFDSDSESDDYSSPALSDMKDMEDALDAAGAPKAENVGDPSPYEPSSEGNSPTAGDDSDVEMGQVQPPTIQSYAEKKREDLKKAEKRKAKSQKLSSKKLRLGEARVKAFLIKTIDDQHVLMVRDMTTAYEIFQTFCNKYEGAAIHGDPYYIQSYLMALKYEEGADLMSFILDLEAAMKAAAEATNSVLSDEQKSLYLYHSLPTEWKSELAVWKGSRKFIPYEDLKHHIETKVQNELARNRYILRQGAPESKETRSERALQASAPLPMPTSLQEPPQTETAVVSMQKCTYCQRDNHDTVDCYILQRHLRDGQVKAGTVLPANFKLKASQGSQSQHPYKGDYKGNRGKSSRNNYGGRGSNNRNYGGTRHDHRDGRGYRDQEQRNKFHGRRNQDGNASDNSEYGVITITTLDLSYQTKELSLTAQVDHSDPTWTIDSGCGRHVTSSQHWFETLTRTIGKSITVGGNHQIPIMGTGTVKMVIKDTKDNDRVITLNNVLYAPDLKFNLLSVCQAVEYDYKINFPTAKKCVLFFKRGTKFEATTGEGTRLYQFKARPADTKQEAHVANSGSD